MFSEGLQIGKHSFQDAAMPEKNCISGHIANKFQRPTILQLNIEGFIASKMNVLHYLALQSEALVIQLQETHCNDAEKLVLSRYLLARYACFLPCHVCVRTTKVNALDQSSPTSEIEWLCVDVDGYKIVNVYKPPSTLLRSLDLPVFPHPYFVLAISTVVMLIGVTVITVRTVSAWLAGLALIILPFYTMPRTPPVFTPATGTLAPIQI